MKDTPKRRGIRYAILQRAACEVCTADCKDQLDAWVLDGLCADCRKKTQQRVSGR